MRISTASTPRYTWPATIIDHLNSLLAGLMLAIIVTALILLWPVGYLGYDSTDVDQQIYHVVPDGPADQAGVKVGDRILALYNRPIQEVVVSLNLVDLIGQRDRPIPIVVQRAEQTIATTIRQDAPSFAFQATKLAFFGLGLLCWTTGYFLGVVRRHEVPGSSLVASFWLCQGGIIGTLLFARLAAYPIFLAETWMLITVLAPMAVYIHLWFPQRTLHAAISQRRARAAFIALSIILNTALAAWVRLANIEYLALIETLFRIVPFAIISALAAAGWLLIRTYRATRISQTRRRIRIIAGACFSIMLLWLLLSAVPVMIAGQTLIATSWLTLSYGLVPLAYLATGHSAGLFRWDRVAMRMVLHLLTATLLGLLLGTLSRILGQHGLTAVSWSAIGFVIFYRPIQHTWTRLFPTLFGGYDRRALDQAMQALPSSLDAQALVDIIATGVRAQFGDPAQAFYLADIYGEGTLTLRHQEYIDGIPWMIHAGALTRGLCQTGTIVESRALCSRLAGVPLSATEEQLLLHPTVVLWCTIGHSEGHLLGLLVLGMKGDLDDYPVEDLQGLERLSASASLAFSKSAAHAQIHELYHHLQTAHDDAASELARKLHDDIINGLLRQNTSSLKRVVRNLEDDELRDILMPILHDQEQLASQLRRISDEWYPIGIDDPLGLPLVLQTAIDRQRQTWDGQCLFAMSGSPLPVGLAARRAAFRITQEAVTNAIKHADATCIHVHLRFPESPADPACLTVRDDGRNAGAVAACEGHRGVPYMQESARAAMASLVIESTARQGTTITFTFPTMGYSTDLDMERGTE